MKISIDIGNGYVKAITEKGEKLHFPTVLKENHEINILSSRSPYSIEINGINYFMGKLAAIKKGIRRWETSKAIHQDTEKYIALCCHLLSEKKKEEIELCLGLPYSYYLEFNKGEKLLERLKDYKCITKISEEEKRFQIKKVSVYPQGIGAYFSNLYDISGKPKKDANHYIKSICVDIGYRTVDVVSFDVLEKQFELIYENSFSLEEQGMFNTINRVVQKASTSFELTPTDVEFAIEYNNGVFESMYEDIDLNRFVDTEYERLAEEIVKNINLKLSGDINKYKNIFLTGGGAVKLYPYMKKAYPSLILQDDYVFCNAKGYLALENTKG